MQCLMCDPGNEYAFLKIKKYKYWEIILRNEQNYLGWCLVVLNRHLEDLMDISLKEQNELFEITKLLKKVLKNQFKADALNYASLGNITAHLHLQVIPRYKRPVIFEDTEFKDNNWGKNYSPYNKKFEIPKEIKLAIKEAIQKELE